MSGRRSQPRRKASSSSQARREDSWQLLDNSENNAMDIDSTDMEVDDQDIETERGSVVNEHPIRRIADRVGREVEAFAEKLDAWSGRPRRTTEDKNKAAADLVRDFSDIAESTVETLRQRHAAELRDDFRRSWLEKHTNLSGGKDRLRVAQEEEYDDTEYNTSATTVRDLRRWQAELHTWQLLQKLLACRYPSSESPDAYASLLGDRESRFGGDSNLFKVFIDTNNTAKERLLILKWLEQTAEETEEDINIIEREVEEISGRGRGLFVQGWMDTKEKIKSHKRLRLWSAPIDSGLPEIWNSDGTELLVTQLDGDAATRQSRTLEKADQDFEMSFWTVCWELLRRGTSMNVISDWCQEKNEFSRALSMGASPVSQSSRNSWETFSRRYLWRRVCLQLARYGGLSDQERAVFALLGGDFEPVSKVCLSWNDLLYAHYNAHLIAQFESFVTQDYSDKPAEYPVRDLGVFREPLSQEPLPTVARRLVSSLSQDPKSQISKSQGLKTIQANLIGHTIGTFILQQAVGLSRSSAGDDPDPLIYPEYADLLPNVQDIDLVTGDNNTLRVLAHMTIIFQDLGVNFGTGDLALVVENIVAKYITFLRLLRKIELIPHYSSHLTQERGEYALATVCQDVTHTSEMLDYINLINVDGIDLINVMRYQYGLALQKSSLFSEYEKWSFPKLKMLRPESDDRWPNQRVAALPHEEVKADEMALIYSGEWFQIMRGNWEVSFGTLARIAITFLRNGRLHAAMDLYDRLPFAAISTTKTAYLLGRETDIMADDNNVDEAVENDLSMLQLLSVRRKQPRSSSRRQQIIAAMKVHGRVYYELGQLVDALRAINEYTLIEAECVKSNGGMKDELRTVIEDIVEMMQPLLQPRFLSSDWSEEKQYPSDHAKSIARREHNDLASIRTAYLPELVLAYISALHFTAFAVSRQTLLQVMNLSTEIAENATLTEAFVSTGRMGELVDAFAASSRAMLKLNERAGKGKKRKGRGANGFQLWDISV